MPFIDAQIEHHVVLGPYVRAAEDAWDDFVQAVANATGVDLSTAGKPCLWLDDTETA